MAKSQREGVGGGNRDPHPRAAARRDSLLLLHWPAAAATATTVTAAGNDDDVDLSVIGLRANLSVLGGGVGGVDSPEDLSLGISSPSSLLLLLPASTLTAASRRGALPPLRSALLLVARSSLPWLALSSLLSRVSPHLAHLALSVGFIKAHSEQCHCNTDAIEPILHA